MKILRALVLFALLVPLALSAQVRWTTRNPAPTTIAIKALTAGKGIYVAVTWHGTVVTSTDTVNWQTENFPSVENLNNVAFANGHFFARGDSGTIFVSDDGHYWLQRLGGGVASSGGPAGHYLVYGNDAYVAVSSYYQSIVTSPDAVNFTPLANTAGSRVAFGSGLFLLASSPSTFLTSTDGATWTPLTPTEFSYVNDLCSGAGRFVVLVGNRLFQSDDAQTWTPVASLSVSAVAFVKDRFIAQDATTRQPITSLDGVAWTTHTGASVVIPPGQIAGIGDSFVGYIDNKLYRSDDAIAWTASGVAFSTTAYYPGVAFAHNRFLTGDGYTSTDGATWTHDGFAAPVAGATDLTVHAANDRFFIFTGQSLYTSTDGLTGAKTADLTFAAKSVAYGNGRYVAVGSNADGTKGGVATSTDALAWTDRSLTVDFPGLVAINYAANTFIAIGGKGAIYTSPDGLAWTRRLHPATSISASDIAYGAGRWVIAGIPSLTSTDGITWSPSTAPDASTIAYANGYFVLLAYSDSANNFPFSPPAYLATSPDGVHWTRRDLGNLGAGRLAFGAGNWVSVGYRGSVIQSSSAEAALAPAFAVGLTATLDPENSELLTLDAPASGEGPISYQWYRYHYQSSVAVSGATSSSITTGWRNTSGDVYALVATNTHGSAVMPYRVAYPAGFPPPAHTATLTADGQIALSLTNSYSNNLTSLGLGPLTFQWYKDGVAVPNTNYPSVTLPYDPANDFESIYTVTVTNLLGHFDLDYDLSPQITLAPTSQNLPVGAASGFVAQVKSSISDTVLTFTWRKNGLVVRTANVQVGTFRGTAADSLTFEHIQSSDYGVYQLTVSNQLGTIASEYFTLTPPAVTRLANLSVRAHVGTGDDVLIAGFVGSGNGAGPNVLARGIGPTLATLGVASPLARPHLTLNDSNGAALAANEHWDVQPNYDAGFLRDLMASLGAFALPTGSADAAILRPGALNTTLPPRFTAILSGVGDTTGVGMIELYESAPSAERLINLSARARVGSGENVLIAGFVVTGNTPLKLLIRGVGPTLATKGIAAPLGNPKLTLYDAHGHEIHNNDQWNAAANLADLRAATTATGAFALTENSNDAAMLETLAPGVYSAHVTSVDGSSGVALVEIYEAP